MNAPSRQARLEARITPEVHALLKRAAQIEGRSLTDFVVAAATAAARQAIEGVEILRLNRESSAWFAAMMAEDSPDIPAMRLARDHYERLVGPLPGT